MNLQELIKKGESKTLELKEKLPSAVNLAKTVIAFSNTAGGKIVVGVNDEREIVGVKENEVFDLQEKVSSIIYDMCYPNILPEIYTVNIDGKILLVIEIFRGSLLPYYLKNKGKLKGTYIREGSTDRLADKSIILELERQRMGRTFDEEENLEVDIEDLDLTPILNEFKKAGKEISTEQLKNLKLIKNVNGRDVPTNALLILIGYFDNTSIKCARFKGTTMQVFLDKKEFNGDIFSNLENVILFLKNHLNLSAEINELKRKEEYEIPVVVLREVLLNAVIHRDYTRSSDIKVAVYDDIVEIVSPGGLPNGLTIEEVYNGRSELRNKVIARVFKELGYVETWGSGIKRIINICEEKGIKFELKDEGNFVSVVFHRNVNLSKADESEQKQTFTNDYDRLRTITNDYERLTIEEQKILLYLLDNKKISRKKATEILELRNTKTYEILNTLVNKGLLERHGKGRGTYYTLSPKISEVNENEQ